MADLGVSARRVLSGVWAYRAGAEEQAARRFTRLAHELRAVGAIEEVVALADRAIEDERRHVILCRAMADRYGDAPVPEAAQDGGAIGPASYALDDRVLYEVVAFCCITETLNTSLMKVAYERARVAEVREALRAILRDEVGHARLGWTHLAAERARGRGGFIAEKLPAMVAGAVREELFSPAEPHADAGALERHGELSERDRLAILEHTARDVLVPGFEALGIATDALRAWLARRRARPSTVESPAFLG